MAFEQKWIAAQSSLAALSTRQERRWTRAKSAYGVNKSWSTFAGRDGGMHSVRTLSDRREICRAFVSQSMFSGLL